MYKNNINLNLYKIFYDVAKCGSISKTSNILYISQPAISKSIKKLEEELNVQLFRRGLNGVELTDKGERLLYFVEKSFNNLIIAERDMIETENLQRGKLSIGMPSNIGSFFLFNKIIEFHKRFPNIEITIITGSTSKLLGLLNSYNVDFVIDTSPIKINDNNVIIKELKEVNYCFVVHKNTKIFDYTKITTIKDLEKYPLILPIPGTANRNDLENLLIESNVNIDNVINIHTSEMIISAVKRDLGIGYVIYDLVEKEVNDGELAVLNIKEQLPTVMINLLYDKSYLTPSSKRFIKDYIDSNLEL